MARRAGPGPSKRSPMLIYGRGFSRNENDKRYLNRVYARTGTAAKTRSASGVVFAKYTSIIWPGWQLARARAYFCSRCCIIHECTYKPLLHRVALGRASLSSAHTFASHVVCIAGRAILRATKNSATRLSRSVRRRTTLVPYNENFIGITSRTLLSRRSGFCRMPMRHSRLSGSPKSPGIA